MTPICDISGPKLPRHLALVIALLIASLTALLPAQATMSSQMVIAQTGPVITVEQIVAGDDIIKLASCLNGSDQGLPTDHDCQLCCTLPPITNAASLNPTLPELTVQHIRYSSTQTDRDSAVAPQAYHGRAPPFSV